MRLTGIAAAAAAATGMAVPAVTGGEWPDSPNKLWFENLQRPDNHKRPYQDKHEVMLWSRRRGENQIPRRPR